MNPKRLALLSALLLGACTGSFEAQTPVLLVVGYEDATGGKLALVLDTFGSEGASEDRLEFLPDSVRTLPASPVAYDVVNRAGIRSEVAGLSREDAPTGSTAYLSFFSLSRIDPENPAAFRETESFLVNEFDPVPGTIIDPRFCPVDVQVTQTGAYAALLNDEQVCGIGRGVSIDILDLRRGRLLERITEPAAPLLPGGFYLQQTPTQDLLYYAVRDPGGVRVRQVTLPRPGAVVEDELPKRNVASLNVSLNRQPFRDLGLVGNVQNPVQARLVTLFDESFFELGDYTGTPEVGEPVETPGDNRELILDDTLSTDATLILGANRFSYFPPDAEGEEDGESTFVEAVDAVVEPTFGFVYFVLSEEISIFDLRTYTPGADLDIAPFPVVGITDPSFITWTQALPLEP